MKILVFNGDLGGCYIYRVQIPFAELKRQGVSFVPMPELPNNPWGNDFDELLRYIGQFDFVVVQRCYKIEVVRVIKTACEVLNKKLVFETDDDYFHIPPSNPCHAELAKPGAREGYAQILAMSDMVTVSTKELKDTIYPFNKNVIVLPNNIENVFCGTEGPPARAYCKEVPDGEGKIRIPNTHGLINIPSYWETPPPNRKKDRVVRIGYSGTPSHYEDWETIRHQFDRFVKKYAHKCWFVFIGDKYFYDKTMEGAGRKMHVPISSYSTYLYHLRNLDIGLAPLAPNLFNMSKSPIKAVEYGAWGVPAVLPHYVTYTRDFTNGLNCLTYYNAREFFDVLEELVNNHELRERLGQAARDHVAQNRIEALHSETRFNAYASLIAKKAKRFEVAV